MRKIILFSFVIAFVSCQESLEERCARETQEFTKKNCPVKANESVTIDSMTFDKTTTTLHYYYTVSGKIDNEQALYKSDIRKSILNDLRNTTSIKNYKEAGYNFAYTYWSASRKGQKLVELTFTKKDYE